MVKAVKKWKAADPAPLGLSGFAATTFLLSGANAGWIPLTSFAGAAAFYGGFAQLLAGMWEFANGNVFGATAFSTYGGFWMSLFVMLNLYAGTPAFNQQLGYFLTSFLIFNSYAWLGSFFLNRATWLVFTTLELAFILLVAGNFKEDTSVIKAGGYMGIICAAIAFYTAAAGLINATARRVILPVGDPIFFPSPEEPEEVVKQEEPASNSYGMNNNIGVHPIGFHIVQ